MLVKLIWQGCGSPVGRLTLLNAFLPNLAVQIKSLRLESILRWDHNSPSTCLGSDPWRYFPLITTLSYERSVLMYHAHFFTRPSFWSHLQTSKVLRPRLARIRRHLGKHFFCGTFRHNRCQQEHILPWRRINTHTRKAKTLPADAYVAGEK